jgi:hypothetical protein
MQRVIRVLAAVALLTVLAAPVASADSVSEDPSNLPDYPGACQQVYQLEHGVPFSPVVVHKCYAQFDAGVPTPPQP